MYRGHARSTGGSSQQGLLPEVYRTANTGEVSSPTTECSTSYGTKNPTTKHTLPHKTLAVYIANDTLRHRPMEAGHMTVLSSAGLLDSYPALLLYLAGDALYQQPMGSRSHDCSSYVGCGGNSVSYIGVAQCLPAIGDDRLWHPDDHLIWCPKVDSGPRKLQLHG